MIKPIRTSAVVDAHVLELDRWWRDNRGKALQTDHVLIVAVWGAVKDGGPDLSQV